MDANQAPVHILEGPLWVATGIRPRGLGTHSGENRRKALERAVYAGASVVLGVKAHSSCAVKEAGLQMPWELAEVDEARAATKAMPRRVAVDRLRIELERGTTP